MDNNVYQEIPGETIQNITRKLIKAIVESKKNTK